MKQFNNLVISIMISIGAIFTLVLTIVFLVGVNTVEEIRHRTVVNIAIALFFGIVVLWSVIFIVVYCYGYWVITDSEIQSKNLLRRKVTINKSKIIKVEKNRVSAMGVDLGDAYVIYSDSAKITILINKRNKELLKEQFENECYKEIFVDKTLKYKVQVYG